MSLPNLTNQQVSDALPEYTDVQVLNAGGQKLVFRGKRDGLEVVLKFLAPPLQAPIGEEDGITVIARAERELRVMSRCNCPYLVKSISEKLQYVDIDGVQYIYYLENFINGENLKDIIARGPISSVEAREMAIQVSTAIDSLWSERHVHRDIKPANIVKCSDTGNYMLLDMGFALDLSSASLSKGVVGTLIYFSPEQTDFGNRRRVLDFRSDLFSLGIVLYEALTGRHPFIHSNTRSGLEVLINIKKQRPVEPKQIVVNVPEALNNAIMRLLSKTPALRYRSIKMLHDALESF